jgi:hypothetical protein
MFGQAGKGRAGDLETCLLNLAAVWLPALLIWNACLNLF